MLLDYLESEQISHRVPLATRRVTHKGLMHLFYECPTQQHYTIMLTGVPMSRAHATAIEGLRDGHVWKLDRTGFKRRRIDRPGILVLAVGISPSAALIRHKWEILKVEHNHLVAIETTAPLPGVIKSGKVGRQEAMEEIRDILGRTHSIREVQKVSTRKEALQFAGIYLAYCEPERPFGIWSA